MPAAKRTRASTKKHSTPATKATSTVQAEKADDDLFEATFDPSSESEQDSDHSAYGSKRRAKPKRRKTTHHKHSRAPKLPDLSDDEYEDPRAESIELGQLPDPSTPTRPKFKFADKVVRKSNAADVSQQPPSVLQIQVQASKNGTATINLDLASILLGASKTGQFLTSAASAHRGRVAAGLSYNDYDSTLVEEDDSIVLSSKKTTKRTVTKKDLKRQKHKTGFLDLPYEIRVRVYRQVFVTESPIDFTLREDFPRSSGFLSTCIAVYDEGRAILYGENAFHFERTSQRRGHFFEKVWKEVGFKDVRRFLDVIGSGNISRMKYVSFLLVDAAPSFTPYLEEEERRYVNDPVLHYIFNLLGNHAILSKVAFTFAGRRPISTADFHFLKAITSIRCHEFVHAVSIYPNSKVGAGMLDKMKKVMVMAREDEEDIDVKKRKQPTVRMHHEKPKASNYYGW